MVMLNFCCRVLIFFWFLFSSLKSQSSSIGWQSFVVISSPGLEFSPINQQVLLWNWTEINSVVTCAQKCQSIAACRTFNFDSQSDYCRIYEGDITSTGSIIQSSSLQAVVGSIEITPDQFVNRGQSCSFCQDSRYLQCSNSTCQCQPNTFFNGSICQSQKLNGRQCIDNTQCRGDLGVLCFSGQRCDSTGWLTTGSMNGSRYLHTASILQNNQVLIAGGFSDPGYLDTVEIYNPSSGNWARAANMMMKRYYHSACVLNDGKVLVTGGTNSLGYLTTVEVYDPTNGNWSNVHNMSLRRSSHTTSVLLDGRVLVVGGVVSANTAELYDPSTGYWTNVSNMASGRYYHTATVLSNGKVLVVGGTGSPPYKNTAELFDPSTRNWASVGNMNFGRYSHTASVLSNGKVLVTGGDVNGNTVELYNPSTGNWTVISNMSFEREDHTASVLSNGKVLVTGGDSYPNTVELYDPSTGNWTIISSMSVGRYSHTASILSNGKVLVAGGYDGNDYQSIAEIYYP